MAPGMTGNGEKRMDRIIVLMSTYNGERFLREQVDSILAQQDVEVELLVRDDGSTDGTLNILREYQEAGKLTWYAGDNLKPARSFMDLIRKAGPCEYYALSDQDDFWLPQKLTKAIQALKRTDSRKPALYCSRTILTDADLHIIGDNRKRTHHTVTIRKALISSGGTGCTMCFNRALLDMLRKPCPEHRLMHDNWIYKVCVAVGGNVYHDDESYIWYRQHGNNTIGAFAQTSHPIRRHLQSIKKEKCYRSEGVAALYEAYKDDMPEENRQVTELLAHYKKGMNRWRILRDKGFATGNEKNDRFFKISVLSGLF